MGNLVGNDETNESVEKLENFVLSGDKAVGSDRPLIEKMQVELITLEEDRFLKNQITPFISYWFFFILPKLII